MCSADALNQPYQMQTGTAVRVREIMFLSCMIITDRGNAMKIETRELTGDMWPDVERLFGVRGACGGCWCMSWRIEKGEKWESVKGEPARKRLQKLVQTGDAHGIIAFIDGEPVGWCTFGPRRSFSRLDRAPSLACDDGADVWSIPCFFIRSGHRGRGVATALLEHALRALITRGAHIVEGYPAKPPASGKPIPAAFAWTGTRSLFLKAGFEIVGNKQGGKQRARKYV